MRFSDSVNPPLYETTHTGTWNLHIDLRHFYVRDLVDTKIVTVQRSPTTEMLVDILTKPLHHIILAQHVHTMMSTQ
jgi:hypothetical protein